MKNSFPESGECSGMANIELPALERTQQSWAGFWQRLLIALFITGTTLFAVVIVIQAQSAKHF